MDMSIYGNSVMMGGGGSTIAFISVTYPSGSTCTCSDGTTTLHAEDTSGAWIFDIPNTGTWTVSCTDGEKSCSLTVQIPTKGQAYPIKLTYSLLIASSIDAILADAKMEDYSPLLPTWGGLTLVGQSGFTVQSDGSVNLYGNSQSAYYDLGAANTSVTNYMVFKSLTSSSMSRLISNVYANSTGNAPGFYRFSNNIYTTYYSDDVYTGVSAVDGYHVLAESMNGTTKAIRFFVDGVRKDTRTASNIGRYTEFTATTLGSEVYGGNTNIKYMAVVSGAEADATIIANMQNIMAHYEIS